MMRIITKTQRHLTATLMLVSVLSIGLPLPVIAVTIEVPTVEVPVVETGSDEAVVVINGSNTTVVQTCSLRASASSVNEGGNVTLSWETSGFDTVTLDGVPVNPGSQSKVISNITDTKTYTLQASGSGGNCTATVDVECIKIDTPPVPAPACALTLAKAVNVSTVTPGQEFTYTLTVENTGDADCGADSGVKIEDVLATNLQFVEATVSSNMTLGYGTKAVYTPADRIVRFNGNTLTPGERGTMTIRVQAPTPATCGDVSIVNTANVTAKELYNFQTRIPSNTVTVVVDNDCAPVTPSLCAPGDAHYNPEQDLTGTITLPGTGSVTNTSEHCNYAVGLASYEKFDEVIDNQIIFDRSTSVVNAKSTATLTVGVPACAYQIDLFYGNVLESLTGQRYGDRLLDAKHVNGKNYCGVPVQPQCPYTSADGIVVNFGDTRLFSSRGVIQSQTVPVAVTIPVGEYGVRLVAWDGYAGRETITQPKEQYRAVIADENGVIAKTNTTADLADRVKSALFNASVDSSFLVTRPGSRVYAEHTAFPDLTSPNSLNPICAVFIPVPKEEPPVLPECPFVPQAGRTIVNFTDVRVRSDQGLNQSQSPLIPVALEAGSYAISLASWDGYLGRETQVQPNERWQLGFFTNDTELARSAAIGDLEDSVVSAQRDEQVNTALVLLSAITHIRALHAVYPDVTSANSLNPICAAIDEIPQDPDPVLSCDVFTATPTTILKGSTTTLAWETTNATRVVVNNGVGEVAADGTISVAPLSTTEYELTAFGVGTTSVSCVVPVLVEEPPVETPFTCENNVTFGASPININRGGSATLTWSTTDVDSVSISGINATALTGSQTVSPTSDTTYVLTATKGTQEVSCPVSVDVGTGGGGGGSASPRCELTISDRTITRGDKITLRWDTSRATNVVITDDRGNVIVTTENKIGDKKEELFDGSITLTPTRDTAYTLLASRGSRDRECSVAVAMEEDDIVVLEIRDQQPLVAGIALSAVPYTGFEAGPFMTIMFYALLVAWALYIAYVIVVRPQLVGQQDVIPLLAPEATRAMQSAEAVRPDVFVSVTPPSEASPAEAPLATDIPVNLPTGTAVVGYEAMTEEGTPDVNHPHQATDAMVTMLEDRAHAQKALLSSDAVRFFIARTEGSFERIEILDQVIAEAKSQYPLEDGWIVLNEVRMSAMCDECSVPAPKAPVRFVPTTVPEGSGSLAEAIVTGNVVAAYAMIGTRPMFALADAAADFDSIVRLRKGNDVIVSDLLKTETTRLTDAQLAEVITALTGALDGTYTDEASAVKMAIMKAVKVVA